MVKWKGFDVPINDASCNAGDASGYYTAGYTRKATDPIFGGAVKQFSIPAGGIPDLYVLNPAAMDNPEAFQNKYYPATSR